MEKTESFESYVLGKFNDMIDIMQNLNKQIDLVNTMLQRVEKRVAQLESLQTPMHETSKEGK